MNPEDAQKWQYRVLEQILHALAESNELKDVLIFKGALILNARLGAKRMSLDIDSNMNQEFVIQCPDKDDQEEYLTNVISTAINKYFNRQEPVRFELETLKIKRSPPRHHPRGWDAFSIKIRVQDYKYINVRYLPTLSIDVAAPELLYDTSVSYLDLGGCTIKAYTLERIAGEKLRAFLSTLPAYRRKVSKPGEALRVKDLYDLARIYRVNSINNELFWELSGREFRLACSSRFICP